MLWSLMIVMVEEEQPLCRQTGKVICPAVREVACGSAVIQVEALTKLLLKPLLCCAKTPLLFNREENLVQAKQLILTLCLLGHKTTNIFMVCIGVGVNRSIGQCVLVNEVVNKL